MFAITQTSPYLLSGYRMHAIPIFDSLPFRAVANLRHMLFSTFPRNALSFRAVTSLLSYVAHTAGLMRLPLRKRASPPSSTINWTSEGLLPQANHTCAFENNRPIGQTHDGNHRLGLRLPEHKESRTLRQSFKSEGR